MKSNKNPLVSVIVPAYNAEKYIGNCIKSVLQQTYPYFELIIVDDSSTDNTVKIIKSFIDKRIKFLQQINNNGVSSARNNGLSIAQGQWVTFLDADDQWLPTRLEHLIGYIKKIQDSNFFISDK